MSQRYSLPIISDAIESCASSEADLPARVEEVEYSDRYQRQSKSALPITFRILSRAPRFLWAIANHRLQRDCGPHSLTHTTTFRCNYHCKEICDSPLVHQAMQQRPNGHDLTTAEVRDAYRQLPKMDYVRFTGGEPTLRADFIELSHLAEEHLQPVVLHLTTNASIPARVVQFAVERPRHIPLDLMISIDGFEEKHCQSRHNHMAYIRCMETLEALAPRQKELRLNIRINQTIANSEGIQHYRKLHEALKPFDVRHQIVMAYDASATYSVERDRAYAPTRDELFKPVGEFAPQELEAFFAEVRADITSELNGPERWIQGYYLDGIHARMRHNQPLPNPACVALSSHLRIFPNGDIPTCQFNSHLVGNLRLHRFREIWDGESRRQQHKWVRSCAGCWAGCEVQPSAAYTGDLLLHQFRRQPVMTT